MIAKISIIIPIYNTRQYLIEAIDSLLVQESYIKEIILVNDGSTDGSKEIIETNYANQELFKIIHSENRGQGNARNLGLEIATGDFIYFFDSDDLVSPNLFEEFHKTLSKYPNLNLYCFSGHSFIEDEPTKIKVSESDTDIKNSYKRNCEKYFSSGEEAFNHLVEIQSFFPGPPLYLVKKELLDKLNIKFFQIRYEDEEYSHRLFLNSGPIYVTNNILFNRRIRSGSTMQIKRTFKDFQGYFKLLETLTNLKNNSSINSKTIKTLEQRIKTFIKIIIQTKEFSKIKFTEEEKKIFRRELAPYLATDYKLKLYYYFFPLEIKLRDFKKLILGDMS